MATTIRDVAEAAGVSPMAVSKVLHGRGETVRVSKDKAALIKKVAEELRYHPNHLARNFRNRKTHTVGLVFERFQALGDRTGYFSQLLNGIMSATFPRDYSLTICPMLIRNSHSGVVFDGRFDGIIWCKPDLSTETRACIVNAPFPIVTMHVLPERAVGVPSFCCDNRQALDLAISHLKSLGHERVAFAVDYDNEASLEAQDRMKSFLSSKRDHGMSASECDLLVWDHDGEDLEAYWNGPSRHTAIVCFSESHAVSLLRKCEQLGIHVPEELSIIGFDSTSYCESTTPRLTAISQPVERMASEATQALISFIEGAPVGDLNVIYPCGLDIRESTARPSSHRRGG